MIQEDKVIFYAVGKVQKARRQASTLSGSTQEEVEISTVTKIVNEMDNLAARELEEVRKKYDRWHSADGARKELERRKQEMEAAVQSKRNRREMGPDEGEAEYAGDIDEEA